MPKIFVCHRRENTADVSGRIFDRLVMNYGSQQILKDLDSIPLGVDFREYLGRIVSECDVFLVVIGPGWLDAEGDTSRLEDPGDFVRIEIESALTREIPIVPLFVGGASMPSAEDVPQSIRPVVYRNGIPVRSDPDFHTDMDRVIAGLDGYGRPAPPSPAETAAPSRPMPIPPAVHDCHRDAERERVRTDAERTLAEELTTAQERHYADIARLEAESAETVDAAPRNAQALADAEANDRLTVELDRAGAAAERTLADALAVAEKRHRAEIARLEIEALESRDAATRDAQASAEVRAQETLAADLDRVRADAARTLANALAADRRRVRAEVEVARLATRLATAEERHHAEIARLQIEAVESRDAAVRDAQTAADVRAGETLAAELTAAEVRHRTEIARLEVEATERRDPANRDAQALAPAQADDRLTAEPDWGRAAAERTVTDELTVAETRHRAEIARLEAEAAEIRDAANRDAQTAAEVRATETLGVELEAGMMDIPAPTMTEQATTVLIVAQDEVQTAKSEPGFKTNIRVFADTDAIRALQCISRDRPRVVVLERAFVGRSRGAALVNAIKTDRTLANTQIRVISRASDYLCLVRGTDLQTASDDAMLGEPLRADYLGTRRARRYKLRPGFEVRVDGNPTTLVDLSGTGARLVGSTVLRLKQRVRLVMGTAPEVVRCSGFVVWVAFEPRGKSTPRYVAGTQFIDANPTAIEHLALRHLQH